MNKGNQKGITLIALIITIIVMLILVAVAVRTAVSSGLFGHASDATKRWGDAQEKEGNIGNGKIIIDGTEYESMDEYISSISGKYMLAVIMGGQYNVGTGFMVTENKDYQMLIDDQLASTEVDDFENFYFRNYLDLYVKESDGNKKVFDNNVKNGALCDNYGNYIMGYRVDESTGNLNKDTILTIDITDEDDTQRKGTRIDEQGNIYAIYEDNTENLIAQIAVAGFANPAGLQLSKARPEVYKGTLGSGAASIFNLEIHEELEVKNVTDKSEKETIYNKKFVQEFTAVTTKVISEYITIRIVGTQYYDEKNDVYRITEYVHNGNTKVGCSVGDEGENDYKRYLTEKEFEALLAKRIGLYYPDYTYMSEDEYLEIVNLKR